jgi:hypothetical protein
LYCRLHCVRESALDVVVVLRYRSG